MDWLDNSNQCELCGKTFDKHHFDYNFAINYNLIDIKTMLDINN